MSKLPPPEWAADEIFTYATKLRAKHRVRLFHAARTLSLQPPAQVKRVLIQAYGYYARLGGRTSQVVALVKKLFDEAGAAIEVVEGPLILGPLIHERRGGPRSSFTTCLEMASRSLLKVLRAVGASRRATGDGFLARNLSQAGCKQTRFWPCRLSVRVILQPQRWQTCSTRSEACSAAPVWRAVALTRQGTSAIVSICRGR